MLPITVLQNVLETLHTMREVELAIGRFYRGCAGCWKEDEAFWLNLEGAEIRHADWIEQMAQMIRQEPGRFQTHRPFSITAIRTMISGVEQNIAHLEKGQLDRCKAFILARDIEASIIEKAYHEIVKTDLPLYLTLVRRVVSETVSHKAAIEEKLRECSG